MSDPPAAAPLEVERIASAHDESRSVGSVATVLPALAVTLTTQTLSSFAMIAPSVLAPAAAVALEIAPERVGLFVSTAYLVAMLSGLASTSVLDRFGPLRACQIAVVMVGGGLALGGSGSLIAAGVAAIVIGAGYGYVNPVSSQILASRTPRRIMSLIFSIKQTGVPIGGAIAGASIPSLLLLLGWQSTLIVTGVACAAIAFTFQPLRKEYDRDRDAHLDRGSDSAARPHKNRFLGALTALRRPIALAWTTPALRELSFVSFAYAAMQVTLFAYLVSFFHFELRYSLVTAGLVFSAAQTAGIVGRIAWGAIADHWLPPRVMLGLIGVTTAACALATAFSAPAWPLGVIVLVAALFGATAIGWNGVYLAEVARQAPREEITAATGGTQFFTFLGALIGPIVFGFIVSLTGHYAAAFASFALLPLVLGMRLLLTAKQRA